MRFTIHSIEGNRQRLDGGAMFGNAPKALWQRWVECDELNRIELACRAFLVTDQLSGRRILLESGIGYFFEPKLRERYGVEDGGHRLLANLEQIGISLEAIDDIVLSHLHFDHAGGLLSSWREQQQLELVFPRARFIVGRRAWERAERPHPRDRVSFVPRLQQLLKDSGRLQLVEEGASHPLGDGFSFSLSDGHTPGQLLTEIRGESTGAVFCGDLIPGRPWLHAAISMGYDRYPERLLDEKRALLEHCYEKRLWLLYTHDSKAAASRIEKDEQQRYIPADSLVALSGLTL
jgi:glyoxylase-like metal-dependent hydrolase (beta-lactamase superfamily II)